MISLPWHPQKFRRSTSRLPGPPTLSLAFRSSPPCRSFLPQFFEELTVRKTTVNYTIVCQLGSDVAGVRPASRGMAPPGLAKSSGSHSSRHDVNVPQSARLASQAQCPKSPIPTDFIEQNTRTLTFVNVCISYIQTSPACEGSLNRTMPEKYFGARNNLNSAWLPEALNLGSPRQRSLDMLKGPCTGYSSPRSSTLSLPSITPRGSGVCVCVCVCVRARARVCHVLSLCVCVGLSVCVSVCLCASQCVYISLSLSSSLSLSVVCVCGVGERS